MLLRRCLSVTLILIGVAFIHKMQQGAASHPPMAHDLMLWIRFFALPLVFLGVCVWFLPRRIWPRNAIPLVFVGMSGFVLFTTNVTGTDWWEEFFVTEWLIIVSWAIWITVLLSSLADAQLIRSDQ